MSLEDVLLKKLQYRAADPFEPKPQCLDVYCKVERTWLQKVVSKISAGSLLPLTRVGPMTDELLMADDSKWQSADCATLTRIRKGLAVLVDVTIEDFKDEIFVKDGSVSKFKLDFMKSKGGVIWLSGVAGINVGKDAKLSATVDNLTSASVDYVTLCKWITAGDWRPDVPYLQVITSDWSKDSKSKIKSLWIVTEVLYATKLTVTAQKGLVNKVMANASSVIGVPPALIDAKAEISVRHVNDTTLELKAKPKKQFIVGFRTTRVDYNPDGTCSRMRSPKDGGLRAKDDPYQANLKLMEEDIFEKDEDGDKVPIPLLTLTEQELDDLKALVANSFRDSEGSASTDCKGA